MFEYKFVFKSISLNIHNIITINMAQTDKVKVQLDRDVATMLIQLKQCGDTYSDVIRKLLKNQKGDAQ